jgi:hypothetical protein
LNRTKIPVKLFFGATQTLISFSTIVLAVLVEFNFLNLQNSLNILNENLNFYVLVLFGIGLVFFVGGLFLVYDWWETRR